MKYDDVIEMAVCVKDELSIFCKNIMIAGSIRRLKMDVKDIEIVCQPSFVDGDYPLLNYLTNPIGWLKDNRCIKLKGGNRYQQWQLPEIKLDLFIVLPPAQWGVILALRTGPDHFSKSLVTLRKYGGYLPSYAKVKDGQVWSGEDVIEMPNEKDFFDFCKLPYSHPKDRK